VKRDATGRQIEAQALREPKRDAQAGSRAGLSDILTADGQDLAVAGKRLSDKLAGLSAQSGRVSAVKTLQSGLNKLDDKRDGGSGSTADNAAGDGKPIVPKPARLKEDGLFGPKTAKATRQALVGFGEKPVTQSLFGDGASGWVA